MCFLRGGVRFGWHDHSAVAGHGHLLFMIEEAKQKFRKDQSTIEAPELHILGRSTSSLQACRKECSYLKTELRQLDVTDIIRFFHGDGPFWTV